MIAFALATVVAASPIAITNVRIELGDGSFIARGHVLVDDGKVVAVGAIAVPSSAEKIDGTGKVVTPGLIAVGSQIGLVEVNLEKSSVDSQMKGDVVPGFRVIDSFNPLSPRIAIDREQGVTSAILAPGGSLIRGQGFVVDLSGSMDSAQRAWRAAMFGAFDADTKGDDNGGSRGSMILKLREIFDDVRFYERNRAAYDKAEARSLGLSRVHLDALVDVVEGTLPLVVEVDRAADIHALLSFAREQRIRIMVQGGAEAWLVASELAAAKVPVILRPSSMEPYDFDALRARDDAPALLEKAGVPLILSSGGTELGTTRTRQEAGLAVAYGLPHEAAIRAITETPARVFGAHEIGVLSPGKRADLVLWSGDPLETTSFAEMVLIGGKKMSLETRQRMLAEKYRRQSRP